jgi:uncharacterized protein involved in outer membrane biogenesis
MAALRQETTKPGSVLLRRWIIIIGLALLLALVIGYGLGPRLHALVRDRTDKMLQAHFQSQIQFSDFDVSLFPRAHLTITDLVMRHKGRTDIPPLFQVRKVSVYANMLSLLRTKPRITLVELEALRIHTPPRQPGGKR